MTDHTPCHLAASVRQRLLNIIRKNGDDPNLVWTRYAMERLLYRLSISEHATSFLLKGAMLFRVWTDRAYRPTFDMDLLALREDSNKRTTEIFHDLCNMDAEPDGLSFDASTLLVVSMRQEQKYQCQRVTCTAVLGKARIRVQVDVGFGDTVTPKAEEILYPSLLGFPAPRIQAYPRETVVAEKFEAMVQLGMANSRMKDFYDLALDPRLGQGPL